MSDNSRGSKYCLIIDLPVTAEYPCKDLFSCVKMEKLRERVAAWLLTGKHWSLFTNNCFWFLSSIKRSFYLWFPGEVVNVCVCLVGHIKHPVWMNSIVFFREFRKNRCECSLWITALDGGCLDLRCGSSVFLLVSLHLSYLLSWSNLTHSQKENTRYKEGLKVKILGSLTETQNHFFKVWGILTNKTLKQNLLVGKKLICDPNS